MLITLGGQSINYDSICSLAFVGFPFFLEVKLVTRKWTTGNWANCENKEAFQREYWTKSNNVIKMLDYTMGKMSNYTRDVPETLELESDEE